jgi:hypothetical protein
VEGITSIFGSWAFFFRASLFALASPSMFVYALIFLIMMLCLDEFMVAMM